MMHPYYDENNVTIILTHLAYCTLTLYHLIIVFHSIQYITSNTTKAWPVKATKLCNRKTMGKTLHLSIPYCYYTLDLACLINQ